MTAKPPGARAVLRLSASAFVVLAAEPSFVVIDTAVVGHLGAPQLAGLGVGGTLLSLVAMVGAFLDYGTTGRAARWFGAGQREKAVDEGVTATVLALGLGIAGAGAGEALAGPLMHLLTGSNHAAYTQGLAWFRLAVLGLQASWPSSPATVGSAASRTLAARSGSWWQPMWPARRRRRSWSTRWAWD